VFTDEGGGGTSARCRTNDDLSWGADAIYDIVDGKLQFRSYYKIPPVQTNQENCVSHIPSLIPVPGRDIMVQAWYQGGASVVDFTDSSHPVEIGYFDRGPISSASLVLGGFWSTYWYNGAAYGSEIARGLDAFGLQPTAQLSANEIAAAARCRSAGSTSSTSTGSAGRRASTSSGPTATSSRVPATSTPRRSRRSQVHRPGGALRRRPAGGRGA